MCAVLPGIIESHKAGQSLVLKNAAHFAWVRALHMHALHSFPELLYVVCEELHFRSGYTELNSVSLMDSLHTDWSPESTVKMLFFPKRRRAQNCA